jgi:hypothetical protein
VFRTASQGDPITLPQAFPFLETFLEDAERAWDQRPAEPVRSGPFTAATSAGDVLLRAAATTVNDRSLLVIERLTGLADPRGMLQTARESELDRERAAARLDALGGPADTLTSAARQLLETDLTPAQRALAETIGRSSEHVLAVAQGAWPPPQRRGSKR